MTATYLRLQSGFIKRLEDGAIIPSDDGNEDYRRYLADVDKGAAVEDQPSVAKRQKIDFGGDVADQEDRLQQAVDGLRTFLANPTPTAAQSAAALKVVIRTLLWLLKRQKF